MGWGGGGKQILVWGDFFEIVSIFYVIFLFEVGFIFDM